jgi:transitional endoplasmic reticulum ATPase
MLKVKEALSKDAGHSIARIDPADMAILGISDGSIVEIEGKKKTAVRIMPCEKEDCGKRVIQIDGIIRENAQTGIDEIVTVRNAACHYAGSISIQPVNTSPLSEREKDSNYIASLLNTAPVMSGDRIRINLFGSRICDFRVIDTTPSGIVTISQSTWINVMKPTSETEQHKVSYEDIGGLSPQIARIREMIELPLRFPQIFEKLGVQPPKGVLMYGPPGTGKTVIARAVANETAAWFTHISGPEIIGKFYGESEERLRGIFEDAQNHAPSIIFIDEIDAIAPKREEMGGEKQVERRVVAQMLALMDGLESRGQIVVIGATNIPNSLDPALRRPGRFDREIAIPIPDRKGRLEILEIHTRGMPLARDVDLKRIADLSHGYVGADLEALAKEAAMACIREILPEISLESNDIPYERIVTLEVKMEHFLNALREIDPSAIREVFVEVSDVSWSDIGGLDNVKEELSNAVMWPLQNPEIFDRYNVTPVRAILIHGKSGTGKTLLAKALAKESGVNFISVKGPSLMSKYVGESERAIREVFKIAKQAAPSILYFDEIESLVPARGRDGGAGSAYTERVISQFLAEMSGIEELRGVIVLATTNRIDLLDPSLISSGRFDVIIELHLPDFEARKKIFEIHLRKKPLGGDVDLKNLASLTKGMNGGDIAFICRKATMLSLHDFFNIKEIIEPQISWKHLEAGIIELSRRMKT